MIYSNISFSSLAKETKQLPKLKQGNLSINSNDYFCNYPKDKVYFRGISTEKDKFIQTTFDSFLNNDDRSVKLTKKEKFEKLPKKTQKEIMKKIFDIFLGKDDKTAMMTLLGKKPVAFLYDKELFEKYKEYLTSDEIKIVDNVTMLNGGKKIGDLSTIIINVPLLEKTINKNLDYLRYKLSKPNLDSKGIIKEIFGKDFSKKPVIDDDLFGIILGYPFGDSILFHLSSYIKNIIEFLDKSQDTATHAKVAQKTLTIVRPDQSPEARNFRRETYLAGKNNTQESVNEFIKNYLFTGSKWFEDIPLAMDPQKKLNRFSIYFSFHTWDNKTKPIEEYNDILEKAEKECNSKFKTKEELMCYILEKK